jgi:hypothetical protein
LKKAHCVENLYCLRMHRRFLKFLHAAAANPTAASEAVLEAVEEAWDLYKFFVAVGTCVRPFRVFQRCRSCVGPRVLHLAFSFFSFFLLTRCHCSGSCYEISISYLDRKRFMLEVASPQVDSVVFEKVKQSAVTAVTPHFEVRGVSQLAPARARYLPPLTCSYLRRQSFKQTPEWAAICGAIGAK